MPSLEEGEKLAAAAAEKGGGERVTLQDIENAIGQIYFTDSLRVANTASASHVISKALQPPVVLAAFTICMLVMKNGFIVIGTSAPASPQNFDQALGRHLAQEDATKKVWAHMGFALKDRLASGKTE